MKLFYHFIDKNLRQINETFLNKNKFFNDLYENNDMEVFIHYANTIIMF